jgi:rRNA maturation RNase YbeY
MALSIQNRQRAVAIRTALVKRHVQHIIQYLGCTGQELSVVFVNDQRMQQLNRTYRQQDRTTNVLAFPQQPALQDGPASALLGDVIVSLPTAAREAHELRQSLEERVVYLILHGLLHLLGYDHERSSGERQRMAALEAEVLRALRG